MSEKTEKDYLHPIDRFFDRMFDAIEESPMWVSHLGFVIFVSIGLVFIAYTL